MPRLGNPFPIRPNTIPINHCIRRHGAIGQEIIIAHPAIRFHDAQCAEAIPRPRDRTPSRRHCAVGIDHSKVPIALDKNRIHVFKRQNINAGTAARLTGLRQSDIRAKKERWRTSTRQRATSRRAASPASKSKHPLSYFLQRWPSACLNGSSIIVGALQNIRHGQLC